MVDGPDSACVGFLYPGYAAEDDYPRAEGLLGDGTKLPLVHTTMVEDAHRVDALLDIGRDELLAEGAAQLRPYDPDAVVWACTSGSFVFGWDGAHAQVEALAHAAGVPATSTSLAFVAAIRELGLRRVAIAATYPPDVAEHFRAFLAAAGIEVVHLSAGGISTAAEVGTLDGDVLQQLASTTDHPAAEAVLVPDTALHTLAGLAAAERALGKPLLTANQVSIWHGLRLARQASAGQAPAGQPSDAPVLGSLFAARGEQRQ